MTAPSSMPPLVTPDGRYLVVRGRLWRCTNPDLPEAERASWISALMAARRAVRASAAQPQALRSARAQVDAAKVALGERGPVWWRDGAPDYGRHLARNTPYADWWARQEEAAGESGKKKGRGSKKPRPKS